MKSLMLFLQEVLNELGTWCGTSTVRDIKTISDRVEHEGLSFLTITLTNFGSDFQKCLDQGYVGSDQFVGFPRSGGLPKFLGGFLRSVFDLRSGRLLDDPDVDAIFAVRQVTLMFGKMKLPCTNARQAKAITGYIEIEREVRQHDTTTDTSCSRDFSRVAVLLWADVFSKVEKKVFDGGISEGIIPAHGPGSTADSLSGNAKWENRTWTERLDDVFPFGDFTLPNPRHQTEQRLAGYSLLTPGMELPVKVVLVPKTMKTPRIIAMEPSYMQFMQQGVAKAIRDAVEADDIANTLIGWSSQTPNRILARLGSLSGELATLDLSEASDRVSNQHVRNLMVNFPWLSKAMDATRSRKADVPGYGVIRLSKFASMGSALTFPIEAMVFMTVIFLGIQNALNRPLTRQDIVSLLGRVRVYGDDIVVPVEYVHSVIASLETFGLKVNADKSYWSGKFRESCGEEFYSGEDVSIVKVRQYLPTHRTDVTEIVSTVSLRNQLYHVGLWRAVRYLDSLLGRLIPFPVVTENSQILGRHSYLGYETQRICKDLHRPLVRGMVEISVSPVNSLDDVGALMKCLTVGSPQSEKFDEEHQPAYLDLPVLGVGHLERSGRPRAVNIKPRWATPY